MVAVHVRQEEESALGTFAKMPEVDGQRSVGDDLAIGHRPIRRRIRTGR